MKANKELVMSAVMFLVGFITTQIPALNSYEELLMTGFSLMGFVFIGADLLEVRALMTKFIYSSVDELVDKSIEGLDIDITEELENLIEQHATITDGQVEISEEQLKAFISGLVLEVSYDVLEYFGYHIREREEQ